MELRQRKAKKRWCKSRATSRLASRTLWRQVESVFKSYSSGSRGSPDRGAVRGDVSSFFFAGRLDDRSAQGYMRSQDPSQIVARSQGDGFLGDGSDRVGALMT